RRHSPVGGLVAMADTSSAGRFSPGCWAPRSATFPIDESRQIAAVFLRRAAPFLVNESRRRRGEPRGHAAAGVPALRRLVVEGLGHRGRSASLGEAADNENMLIVPEADPDLVAGLHRLRGLGPLAVHR